MTPSRAALNSDPNVVPMIDLLLVLLIIFMLDAMQRRMALELQLPVQVDSEVSNIPIVLEVLPGPSYSLNTTPVSAAKLAAELRRVYAGRPDKVLFVRGDRGVRYQDVIRAFDVARGAGVTASGVVLTRP